MNATTVYKVYNPTPVELSRLLNQMRRERVVAIQKVCAAIVAFLTLTLIISTIVILNNYANTVEELTRELNYANRNIEALQEHNLQITQQLEYYKGLSEKLTEDIPAYEETIKEQEGIIEDLMEDNTILVEEYDAISVAYNQLKDREELYDKYSYAIMYNGKRTELTYDQIQYGEDLMVSKGLDPDLLFSIGMVESRFVENAKNPYSTASGYYQFLRGTGKFVYESLLAKDNSYSHSYAMDGYKSTEMAVCYLDHLSERFDGNLFKMIKQYSGRDNASTKVYIKELDKFLSSKDKTILEIASNMD